MSPPSTTLAPKARPWTAALIFAVCIGALSAESPVSVATPTALRSALAAAKPGTVIRLAPGRYEGGFYARALKGAEGRPIVIEAADAKSPPVLTGGDAGLHLASPAHVELRGLVFQGLKANGLNIDDTAGGPARHVVLRHLKFKDIGSAGNQDALKLSGVEDFQVLDSTFTGWGTGGGSGIDMVGCHRGLIEGCAFDGTSGVQSNGVQAKGGSSTITIRRNRLAQTGGRGVNLGGSTGAAYFRPPLAEGGGNAEARDLRVEGNTFTGTMAPIVFAGVDGAVVRFNTLIHPGRWAVRLLQENTGPAFVPCRRGSFTDNRIVFRSDSWSSGGINVGGGTAPDTFTFARNWWHCTDRPDRSRPQLPVPEIDGAYGRGEDAGRDVAGAEAWKPAP